MKNALLIVPYFGKFNNYFQLFLNSCKKNIDYNWLIITDDKRKFDYPKNVKVVYMDFNDLKAKVFSKFKNEKIILDKPYKLCDFKPMYGFIFEEEIIDYNFWGYCDIDLIFGKISNFIDINKIIKYDKIGFNGHFTLIKNNAVNNTIFLKNNRYKEVIGTSKILKFDEEFGEDFGDSINNIFISYGKKISKIDGIADIYVKSSNFKIINYDSDNHNYQIEKKDNSFFLWNNGILQKYIIKNAKEIKMKEYMYIHLQKRKMKINLDETNIFKIIPNSFENIEKFYYQKEYRKIKRKHFNLHYFYIRIKNLKTKICNRKKNKK